MKNRHQHGRHDDRHNRRGHTPPRFRPEDQDRYRQQTEPERGSLRLHQVLGDGRDLLGRVRGHLHRQSKELLKLADEDDHGDPTGESGGDGVGDEFDQGAELQRAHHHQHDARHDRRHYQPVVTELGHDRKEDRHKRARWAANLHEAATDGGNDEARDDRRP